MGVVACMFQAYMPVEYTWLKVNGTSSSCKACMGMRSTLFLPIWQLCKWPQRHSLYFCKGLVLYLDQDNARCIVGPPAQCVGIQFSLLPVHVNLQRDGSIMFLFSFVVTATDVPEESSQCGSWAQKRKNFLKKGLRKRVKGMNGIP